MVTIRPPLSVDAALAVGVADEVPGSVAGQRRAERGQRAEAGRRSIQNAPPSRPGPIQTTTTSFRAWRRTRRKRARPVAVSAAPMASAPIATSTRAPAVDQRLW